MGLVDEIATETVVALLDVWLCLEAFTEDTPPTYEFLREAAGYVARRRASRKAPRRDLPVGVEPLSPSTRDNNRFWDSYGDIGVDTMTAWDRQEPFRLKIPDRIRVTQGASSPRILCDAPEVFLFPVGWSTTLWLRLLGPLKLEDLPTTLWALDSEPSIRITPGEADPMRLSTVLDTLRDRVAMILYGRSLARRARRIIRQRVVAVIAREASELERPYMDEDLRVIYGALEPSVDGVGPVWVMASSSQEVKQDKGKVVIRYGRGLFLDLQTNPGWTRCQARNFRNMVMMCTVLQATVKFGTTRLPEDLAAFVQLPNEKKAPLRDLYRLVSNGQKILRKLPSAYRPTTCAFYYGQHKEIQDALTQALPNLEP